MGEAMETPSPADALVVEGSCPECGGPYSVGIWDRSHVCEYCASLLALPDASGESVYVVGARGDIAPLDLLVHYELTLLEARLSQRFQNDEGIQLEFPAWIEARLRARERELRASTVVLQEVDFFAPYEIREETVLQGVLGRRQAGPKLSFTQSFQVRELRRRYDETGNPLRDRGLKIHAFRLRPLAAGDLERVSGGALELVPTQAERVTRDLTRTRVHEDVQVVRCFGERWRERALLVLKHLTYVQVRLDGSDQHLLLDRQFHTIAARLEPEEAPRFRGLAPLALDRVLDGARAAPLAAECPDCGVPLTLDPREVVVFCAGCLRAIEVTTKALRTRPCRYESPPAGSGLYFPFWSFPFDLRAGGARYRNLWEWLAAVSPEQRVRRFCESDAPQSRLLVPARTLRGTPSLDRAAELVTGLANWRQPALSLDRPTPGPRDGAGVPARVFCALGADVGADEAAALRRFALLALHDAQSTRRLNAANFRELIEEAELGDALPELALVALPLQDGLLLIPEQGEGVPRALLCSGVDAGLVVRSYPLD